MNQSVSTIIAALIGAAATIIVGVVGPYGFLQRANSQLQAENASLQEENSALQEQTSDASDDLREQISALQEDVAALQGQIDGLRNDNAELQSENERLKQENERLQEQAAASGSGQTDSGETEALSGEYDLLVVCPPYETRHYDAPDRLSVMGANYKNSFCLGADYTYPTYAFFNLNRQYSRLEFDVGHVDGSAMDKRILTVYLDGDSQDPIELNPNMTLTHYSFSVAGIAQVRIETTRFDSVYGNTQYGFVNAKLYA